MATEPGSTPPPPPARPAPPPPERPPPSLRKEFDGYRAAFYLVAGVIALQGVVILFGVVVCAVYASEIVSRNFECNAHDKLAMLLAEALAAALAFAGGLGRRQ
jgi:hypothetical protein